MHNACLVLADGTTFMGSAFGAQLEGTGEVVFHTGLSGYQEVLSDPSYAGQIVCMTCPEIGNVGVNRQDQESRGAFLSGFIVRHYVDTPSSWRAERSLGEYLVEHGIPGIFGVDTRRLVRHIRTLGATNGVLATGEFDLDELRQRAAALPSMAGSNLVDTVTCHEPYGWTEGSLWREQDTPTPTYRVVAYDYGVKHNILRMLVDAGFDVTVVPATTPAREALALAPDGVFLSNGPGDPSAVPYAPDIIRELLDHKPIFGICLGHQLLGRALGIPTSKLRFGHHGANHPTSVVGTGRVLIASVNHGFALDSKATEEHPDVDITHINLNDGCIDGIRHRQRPAFSVQFHPEASPGPHDARDLFLEFRRVVSQHRQAAV
ncbi:MAG: glutamine-hydrolyzing carbamoyl-phosphate synthase small subunit [Myxococcales bacterium FL481]|nr:MAG: glutamine-hydrolyzing carbamoyl-phosphate synthase small subunit [Myxococcales bacterium FL481]